MRMRERVFHVLHDLFFGIERVGPVIVLLAGDRLTQQRAGDAVDLVSDVARLEANVRTPVKRPFVGAKLNLSAGMASVRPTTSRFGIAQLAVENLSGVWSGICCEQRRCAERDYEQGFGQCHRLSSL